MTKASREEKYQLIRLVKSGRTLLEAKALAKSATVAMRDDYASPKDVNVINSIEGGLHNLFMTRGDAQKIMRARFEPRKSIIATREEQAAKFMANLDVNRPLNWERDGNLVRRGPPNKPRPGSSKGKVGRTRFINHTRTLNNLKKMLLALQDLVRQGKKPGKGSMSKIYKSVKRDINITGGKY